MEKCFVIVPFAEEYDDVYQAIKRAGESVGGVQCFRLDDQRPGGRSQIGTESLIVPHPRPLSVACCERRIRRPEPMWRTNAYRATRRVCTCQHAIELQHRSILRNDHVNDAVVTSADRPRNRRMPALS